MRKRICVQTCSGIARRRGGKSYERFSAPAGLAPQTESKGPSFSSTPCTTLFFFWQRKRRGGAKAVYRMGDAKNPAPERGKKRRSRPGKNPGTRAKNDASWCHPSSKRQVPFPLILRFGGKRTAGVAAPARTLSSLCCAGGVCSR